jgi:hypothetical protein
MWQLTAIHDLQLAVWQAIRLQTGTQDLQTECQQSHEEKGLKQLPLVLGYVFSQYVWTSEEVRVFVPARDATIGTFGGIGNVPQGVLVESRRDHLSINLHVAGKFFLGIVLGNSRRLSTT